MPIKRYEHLKKNWSQALGKKFFLAEFIASLVLLIVTMMIFSKFTEFVEMRKGVQFDDPFLQTFKAINLTKIIFAIIYGGILFALILLISFPYQLIILFEAYTLIVLTRLVMMFFLPLSPPSGTIFLQDPFVEFFGTGKTLVNDLFFSGHTATMSLLFLAVPKQEKWVFLTMAFLVAIGVLLQKVHYTVDVLVAPFISFFCYSVVSTYQLTRFKKVFKIINN